MVALNGMPSPEASLALATSGWSHIRGVTAGGSSVRIADITVTPAKYGCAGDGTTDDTTKLNTMISDVRALISSERVRVKIDLNGGVYKVTGNGLNMTGIRAWNFEVCNGVILGNTAGKPVIDLVGSRGYVFRNILVYGDATNTPTLPFLCARGTGTGDGYCDNNLFDNVTTLGYWSVAAFYAYAQETTTHLHCRYWNYRHNANVAIFEGYDSHPQTSVNKTIVTGGHSFINDKYINVDFRYLPVSTSTAITGISKANPAVVTCASHPFVNGDTVIIAHITSGMIEISGFSGTVANATATTFELTGINSTGFTTWTSGGLAVKKATQPAIYVNRMLQHSFDTCYVVAYGDDAIEFGFPDGRDLEECTFDFLVEGACERSHYRIASGTSSESLFDCRFLTYNSHARGSIFSTSTNGSGSFSFYGGEIRVSSHIYNASLPLVETGNEDEYFFYAGTRIYYPNRTGVLPSSYGAFRAILSCPSDGDAIIWDHRCRDTSSGSITPVVTANSGTITTYSSVGSYVGYEGDYVNLSITLTITANGTGAGNLIVALPVAASSDGAWLGVGRCSGNMLQGVIAASGTQLLIYRYDNTYPSVEGAQLRFSIRYKRA